MRHALAPIVAVVALLVMGCQSGSRSGGAGSSSPQVAAEGGDAEQAINKLLDEYGDALLRRDYASLERIWADELTFVNPRGELLTKAQRLDNLRTGKTVFKTIELDDRRIRSYDQAAVATFRARLGAQYSGEESSGDYRVTTTWSRRGTAGEQWQMVAVHMTRIAR